MDINFHTMNPGAEWLHWNGIDYNEELGLVAVSSFGSHEILFIKYRSDEGIVYRWGNPHSYDGSGEATLAEMHSCNWIANYCPGAGNMICYNNGFSKITEFSIPDDLQILDTPEEFVVWEHELTGKQNSNRFSSAQRLLNGNTLASAGFSGYVFEITPSGDVVWDYDLPFGNLVFMARRYYSINGTTDPPYAVTVEGPSIFKYNTPMWFNISCVEPDHENVEYYVEWGDGTDTGWTVLYEYSDIISLSHTWNERGNYTVRAKARDIHGYESDWGTLRVTVSMPLRHQTLLEILMEWILQILRVTIP